MKVKVESEKVGLKLNIQKMKIMASSPITSWEIDGKTVETVSDFIFGDSKITADGDCSYKIKRRLLLGRKVMTNLDSIFKSRDITFKYKIKLNKIKKKNCKKKKQQKKQKQRHYFANKGPSSQGDGFSCGHVWI